MAGAASSSNSATNSQCSTNLPAVVKQEPPQDVSSEIMVDSVEVKIEPMEESKEVKKEPVTLEPVEEPIDIMDSKEQIEKFKRYEADFRQYLMTKYFSDKTIFGGNIFDVKMNIDGETISASRLPPYQSYLDPATFGVLIRKESGSSAETSTTPTTSTSNGKSSTQGN